MSPHLRNLSDSPGKTAIWVPCSNLCLPPCTCLGIALSTLYGVFSHVSDSPAGREALKGRKRTEAPQNSWHQHRLGIEWVSINICCLNVEWKERDPNKAAHRYTSSWRIRWEDRDYHPERLLVKFLTSLNCSCYEELTGAIIQCTRVCTNSVECRARLRIRFPLRTSVISSVKWAWGWCCLPCRVVEGIAEKHKNAFVNCKASKKQLSDSWPEPIWTSS